MKNKKNGIYVTFKGVKKHRMRCPVCGRAAPDDFCMVHGDVKSIDLETSEKARSLTRGFMKAEKEWKRKHKEKVVRVRGYMRSLPLRRKK